MNPLKGITVVTLEHAIAAPFATRQLADLGARVIKIERPGSGDFARGYDERVRGLASHFVWTNRSKESLTLDVKHPHAAQALRRLILEQADVVVQNLAPGATDRLGLSYAALAFAPNIAAAFVIRFLTGIFAGNISTLQGAMADITPPEKRAARMVTMRRTSPRSAGHPRRIAITASVTLPLAATIASYGLVGHWVCCM